MKVAAVGIIRWGLRGVMAARKISNNRLAAEMDVHHVSVSRLKKHDYLPAIGMEEIERIRLAIEKLSIAEYGPVLLKDLVILIDENS